VLSLTTDREVRNRLSGPETVELRRRIARMLRAVALSEERDGELELSVRLTGDAAISALNRSFRGIDNPTDVLAFAQREGERPAHAAAESLLGDLIISLDTAARQSRRGLLAEVLFLAAHGLCHLIGYDHRTDAEEVEMSARMSELLAEAARRGPVRAA
jgi:probable rRNA maturation factor